MALDKQVEQQLAEIKADLHAKKHTRQEVTKEDRKIHQGYLNLVEGAAETVWAKFRVTDACIGCGICTKVCPAGCIYLAIQLNMPEKNAKARYRNANITLSEIVTANNQTKH